MISCFCFLPHSEARFPVDSSIEGLLFDFSELSRRISQEVEGD